jgi:hypothetical protein
MRLIDEESGYDEIEIPLLHSLNVSWVSGRAFKSLTQCQAISGRLCRQIGEPEQIPTLDHGERHWQAWIFSESRRRLATMVRIMNTAFYMDHAFSCDILEGFTLIPLPANKIAWETENEQIWYAEYDKCHVKRSIYGLTSGGKLVRLRQTAKGIESREEGWQKWLASQDSFGSLVMLASQLLA